MGKIKDRPKYQGVTLPVPLINEIKEFVKGSSQYRSIAEFVKQATRHEMLLQSGSQLYREDESSEWKELTEEKYNNIVNKGKKSIKTRKINLSTDETVLALIYQYDKINENIKVLSEKINKISKK